SRCPRFFFLLVRPPTSPLFPYTTLFRSRCAHPRSAASGSGYTPGQARWRGETVVLFHEPRFPSEAKTWDELYIVPLQDLHIGDPRFRVDVFQAVKAWILDAPNRYAIVNGDLFNVALKRSVSSVYEDTMNPREQLRYGRKLFDGLQGRILSATTGNHEERITKETSIDIMEEFAAWLGCVYDPFGVC